MKTVIFLSLCLLMLSCERNNSRINGNEQRDFLEATLRLSMESNILSQPPDGRTSFSMSEKEENEILSKLSESISTGEKMLPEFLNFLQEDMNVEFQSHLMQGMRLYLKGLKDKDPLLQVQGNELIKKWATYWEKNKSIILDNMYPKK